MLFEALCSKATNIKAEDVPSTTRKAVLFSWLGYIFGVDEALGQFRSDYHEQIIAEFRDLDRKHWELGSHRVVRQANQYKPRLDAAVPGSEHQLLFREANKQRRHLPLRKLFAQMPNLLIQLKPCLLMSPMSISQFLDPERIHFDLIIFDEASQVRSEDAVGAIYRGNQLVLCGDNKQLPPTAFFEQGMADELMDESDPAADFDVYDSILDECSTYLSQKRLEWHYRSEHESLDRFFKPYVL